jgi:hypothetical protein
VLQISYVLEVRINDRADKATRQPWRPCALYRATVLSLADMRDELLVFY